VSVPARRVGLLGGSFDPPHLAHRALAEAALARLGLDELRWLPAGQPWQKARTGHRLADGAHRAAMVRLAVADLPRCRIDERELHRAGPSYTVETLRELDAEAPGTVWWLLIGQDQYARLDSWHAWQEIVARARFGVAARAGAPATAPPAVAALSPDCTPLPLPAMLHSSTEVRRRAAAGQDVTALVGVPVARYIAHHRLYRDPPEH